MLLVLAAGWVARQPVNGNIRYEMGVKMASTHSAADTFSHRPLAFRWLMDGLRRVAELAGTDPVTFETALRLLGMLLATSAAWLLWRGLARQQVPWAGPVSLVVLLATVLGGPQFGFEPDWMALVLATAGAGVALSGPARGGWWRWGAAAVLLVGSGAMKGVTLPIAGVALLAVAVLATRRLLPLLLACVVVGLAFTAAMLLWVPWEVQWLLDIRQVQDRSGPEPTRVAEAAVGSALRWPALLLLPAAVVLWPRPRWAPVAAVLLTVLPILAQGKYYGYHFVPLSVVAGVTVLGALRGRLRASVVSALVVLALLAVGLSLPGERWRDDHTSVLGLGGIAVVLLTSGWALWRRRRPPADDRPGVGTASVLLLVLAAATPWATGYAPASALGDETRATPEVRSAHTQTAAEVHGVIGGAGTPVTYLTFGDWTYFLQNPTSCRYPSPLFLQRTRWYPQAAQAGSFAENLACLSDPGARWLVLDGSWFSTRSSATPVLEQLEQHWDCEQAVEVDELTLCPRRSDHPG